MSSTSEFFRRSSGKSSPVSQADSPDSTVTTTHTYGSGGMGTRGKKECHVFEPQQWRKTVCKNCFRTQPEHKQTVGKDEPLSGPNVILRRSDNVITTTSPSTLQSQDSGIGHGSSSVFHDIKSTRENGRNTGNLSGNAARAAARKIAAGQRNLEDSRSQVSPYIEARRNAAGVNPPSMAIYSSASSIDARYIEELENDFFALEDKHESVLREREQLTAELEAKLRTIAELQAAVDQYREKVVALERRCSHMEEEIKGYRERLRLPESDQSPSPHERAEGECQTGNSTSGTEGTCSNELQQRLNEVEQLCQEVMEENEQLKEEVEEMQREIEEMHDHFQEDDRDTMRELQRDLEAANKTCRILQFKLRKAERRFEQCEAERANLEERLARLEAELYSEADVAHIRNLEEEIRVAKEVGVRLNNELDLLDEKRAFFEEENRHLKNELQACHASRISAENELGRIRLEVDRIKLEKGITDQGPLQVTDKNRSRQTGVRPSLSRETSFEEQQLQRELNASRERETDLSEQLRFTEEEIRKLKHRIKETQVENELLSKKMDRLFASQPRDPFQFGQMLKQNESVKTDGEADVSGDQFGSTAGRSNPVENELSMTRRQLNMVEEENLGLRRKVLGYERQLNVVQDGTQRMPNRFPRLPPPDSQELDHLRGQLNLIQDHLARIEQERDRLEGENHRLRQIPVGADLDVLANENAKLKQKFKDWNKKLRQLSREISLVISTERENEWMEKYNEARETIREQELQINRTKKRITELQDENAQLRANERKMDQKIRRDREKVSSSSQLTKEALSQELKSLEEELDEVTADLTAARDQACTAQLRVTSLENNNAELRTEAERRERELVAYGAHLEHKNQIFKRLLALMQERTDSVQSEVDSLIGARRSADCMETSAESQTSTLSALSTGSDDVFDENHEKQTPDIEEQLRNRIDSLEKLLTEERKRVALTEAQLDTLIKDGSGPLGNSENQVRLKQIDLLKRELEEKDEIVEAKDEQIADLKSRIEQSRKMNDALRALLEKEPGTEKTNVPRTELTVEVASYRKEIESSRKEMQILRSNLNQAEKIRERLINDNRELQEELKLREDSIFEQDDEIEKRNAELRFVKASMENLQKELDQAKRELTEAKKRESSHSSGRLSAQIAENERIRAELHETTRELNNIKLKFEDSKRSVASIEDKCSQLSTDTSHLRNCLQEKDTIIIDLNKRLQKTTDEFGQCKLDEQAIKTEKTDLERQLTEAKKSLLVKEQECGLLQKRLDEVNTSARYIERLGSSQDSGISSPDQSRSRDGTLSRRSADVDRLRRELSMVRTERDDLLTEVKRLKTKLEKRSLFNEQGKKGADGSLIGLPTGNAYAKALAAQQSTTKINLLNEHITSLNRINLELKLQNESLQNHVIDYQRRYRMIKEQYEGEQEAWLTERVVLESKAKEQEDRKLTITNTRKLLQETASKLCALESSSTERYHQLECDLEKLEKEKATLESKLAHLEEHQKLPKVLQRFGATTTAARSGMLATQSRAHSAEPCDASRRLEVAERTIGRLRAELNELKCTKRNEKMAALQEAEMARHATEQEAEDLRDRLLTMECYRQQAELFRHRQFETEENAEKEFKIWIEEREALLYRTEEARVMLEQWCTQLQCRADSDNEKADDVVNEVLKQMEKWRASRGKVPCLKRRMLDSIYCLDNGTAASCVGSVPASPGTGLLRSNLMGSLTFSGQRAHTHRSTSMEWGNGRSSLSNVNTMAGTPSVSTCREGSLGFSGSSAVGGGNLRGSAMSLAMGTNVGGGSNYSLLMVSRCGRSVSPEVSIRKISNYPDPTPGFLVRPTSRQGSHDSLSSIGDYTQRAFTLPGKPPVRSAISPARRKFFEENTSTPPPVNGSVVSSDNHLTEVSPTGKVVNHRARVDASNDTMYSRDSKEDTRRVKSASQPPIHTEPPKTHSADDQKFSAGLSIADRFMKCSTASAQATIRNSLNGPNKDSKNVQKASEQLDNGSKNKIHVNSPKLSSNESRDRTATSKSEMSLPTINSGNPTVANVNEKHADSTVSSSSAQTPSSISSSSLKPVKRSGSISTISPAIMALRQKFTGGSKC